MIDDIVESIYNNISAYKFKFSILFGDFRLIYVWNNSSGGCKGNREIVIYFKSIFSNTILKS